MLLLQNDHKNPQATLQYLVPSPEVWRLLLTVWDGQQAHMGMMVKSPHSLHTMHLLILYLLQILLLWEVVA